jgi:hypothetical protein
VDKALELLVQQQYSQIGDKYIADKERILNKMMLQKQVKCPKLLIKDKFNNNNYNQ